MKDNNCSRRDFLNYLIWFTTLGTFGGITVASARYMVPNILYEPPKSYKIGKPQDYLKGVNFLPDKKIFVVRHGDRYKVVSAICTHLGCTPPWVEERNRWECPCHGSIFNDRGVVIAGPAPRPLPWYEVTLRSDGRLFVDENRIVPFAKALIINV
ncbi:MAG: ubiquinol-cytochrome c reductase iron-sulfur subunit [Candidatus Mariimomonas ferrooxydans]